MNVKVHDLMTASVITIDRSTSVDGARRLLEDHSIGAVPVVNQIGEPVGIVSSTDLIRDLDPGAPVEQVMTDGVYSVPQYDDVSTAARVMRNHRIHRVVVTHEKKVVGVLTAFDLLKLVEEHRYVAKNPPTESSRKGSKRR